MRGAKSEEGRGSFREAGSSDVEASSCEVSGQGPILRREVRPVAVGTGLGPEGSRPTADVGAHGVAGWRRGTCGTAVCAVDRRHVPNY